MFVVTFYDPSKRVAGKSYTASSREAHSIGLGWRNVHPLNTFRVNRESTRLAAEILSMQK